MHLSMGKMFQDLVAGLLHIVSHVIASIISGHHQSWRVRVYMFGV